MINANPVKTNLSDLDWYEQQLLMLNPDFDDLDPEEQELRNSIDQGEWVSELTPERWQDIQESARNTLMELREHNLRKLLTTFQDSQWHSTDELVALLGDRLGQVLSDAREQGYVIDQRENTDNRFEYRMPLRN
jgi:hypothetical protein